MRIPPAVQKRRDQEFQATTTRAEVDALIEKWDREDDAMARAESAQAKEVADLRRRVVLLERMLGPHGDMLYNAIGTCIGRARAEARERIDALCKDLDPVIKDAVSKEMTSRAVMIDRGIWGPERFYEAGSVVSHKGSTWCCRVENRGLRPGDANGAWRMMHKSGGGS